MQPNNAYSIFNIGENYLNFNIFITRTTINDVINFIYKFEFRKGIKMMEDLNPLSPDDGENIRKNIESITPIINMIAEIAFVSVSYEIWLKERLFIKSYYNEGKILSIFESLKSIINALKDMDSYSKDEIEVGRKQLDNIQEIVNRDFNIINSGQTLDEENKLLNKIKMIFELFDSSKKINEFIQKSYELFNKDYKILHNKISAFYNYLELENEYEINISDDLIIDGSPKVRDFVNNMLTLKEMRNYISHPESTLSLWVSEDERKLIALKSSYLEIRKEITRFEINDFFRTYSSNYAHNEFSKIFIELILILLK